MMCHASMAGKLECHRRGGRNITASELAASGLHRGTVMQLCFVITSRQSACQVCKAVICHHHTEIRLPSVQVVDWDKLEAEVKDEEKKEQLDGDAGVNRLFQQIYAGALLLSPSCRDRHWPPATNLASWASNCRHSSRMLSAFWAREAMAQQDVTLCTGLGICACGRAITPP